MFAFFSLLLDWTESPINQNLRPQDRPSLLMILLKNLNATVMIITSRNGLLRYISILIKTGLSQSSHLILIYIKIT